MDERHEGMRNIFKALTSRTLSRNNNFAAFVQGWSRTVHRRFRVVQALARDAERLSGLDGTTCSVIQDAPDLRLRLSCEALQYRRTVVLRDYEWQWLQEQPGVRSLLLAARVPLLHGTEDNRQIAAASPSLSLSGEPGQCN